MLQLLETGFPVSKKQETWPSLVETSVWLANYVLSLFGSMEITTTTTASRFMHVILSMLSLSYFNV
jgi:hypothetical protein